MKFGRAVLQDYIIVVKLKCEWLKSTNLQFFRCYILVDISEIRSTLLCITTTRRFEFLLAPIRMTLNDPECL